MEVTLDVKLFWWQGTTLSISLTIDLLGFSQPSPGFSENGAPQKKYPVAAVGRHHVMVRV